MRLVRRLLDDEPDVFVHEVDPRQVDPAVALLPGEAEDITRAILSRQQQYAAGRLCVRKALRGLAASEGQGDYDGFELRNDEERAPVFPEGLVGNITHTKWWAAAAVARVGAVRSVGLDIEPDSPLKPALFDHVMTPVEREHFATLPEGQRGRLAKLLFSAKECAYKCQFMVSRQFYGFHGMRVEIDTNAQTFDAIFLRDAAPFSDGDVLRGRFVFHGGYVMTTMVLR